MIDGRDGNGLPLRGLVGSAVPTFRLAPKRVSTLGPAVARIAEIAGDVPDPWHLDLWDDLAGVDEAGDFVARTAEIEVARRNAKTWCIHRYVLARALLLDAPPIVWTSYRQDAALQAFAEMEALIERVPSFRRQLVKAHRHNGMHGMVFKTGATIKYRTRKASVSEASQGGRSLEAGVLVLDEDQDLNDEADSALWPLTATIPGAQRIYLGSAGGQRSTVKARLIHAASQGAPRLVCYRWAGTEDDDLGSEETWQKVLPALNRPAAGRLLTYQTIADAYTQMPPAKFSREWMTIGDYPRPEGDEWVIPRSLYKNASDPNSSAVSRLVWSIEIAHDLGSASISVAGWRRDGAIHMETVRNEPGYRWAVPELARLVANHPTLGVAVNYRGSTRGIRGAMADHGLGPDSRVPVLELKAEDQAQAFVEFAGAFSLSATHGAIRHRGAKAVTSAFAAAKTRKMSTGAATWSSMGAEDVTPILSWTWAYHGLRRLSREDRPSPSPVSITPGRDRGIGSTAMTSDLATAAF